MTTKTGNMWLSFEITSKISTCDDPITQDIVEKCIRIALDALEGKRDRDGNALILHSLIVGSMGQTDAEKCVGIGLLTRNWDLVKTAYKSFMADKELIMTSIKHYDKR